MMAQLSARNASMFVSLRGSENALLVVWRFLKLMSLMECSSNSLNIVP